MLMTPDDQVEEIWDERFWDETCWTTLGSILVKHQDVEPLPATKVLEIIVKSKVLPALLSKRQLKLNLVLSEESVQPLVLHMGEAIQCHLGSQIVPLRTMFD